jgi:toxin ParE1/3/4
VTRKYAYIVYYMVDEDAEEIIVLAVKHPAQKPAHFDA